MKRNLYINKNLKARVTNARWILCLVFCLFISTSYSQEVRYEDFYKEIGNLTNDQVYSRLFKYRAANPQFANAYIQLANVSEKIFKELDPLREIELVEYWTANTILYYELFAVYFNGAELRRNREFYANIPVGPPGYRANENDFLQYAQARKEYTKNYKDSVRLIFDELEISKDHYNNCVRIFNYINRDFDNLNEVLLKTDESFLDLLKELEFEFNSSIASFDKYKALLTLYPLKGHKKTYQVKIGQYTSTVEAIVGAYNQHYQLKPIQTFRLDGITNSDFLKDTFNLWNYGLWIENYRKVYNSEVVALKKEVQQIQKNFDDNIRFLSRVNFVEPDMEMKSYDEFFLFRLGKFDNNSLIRELFDYLNVRQDFMLLGKHPLNNPSDSTSTLASRKLRFYYRFAIQLKHSNSSLDKFCSAITPNKVSRFKWFFDTYYKGEQGLQNYCPEQKTMLKQNFDSGLDNLKAFFENEKTLKKSLRNATGKGADIPLRTIDENDVKYSTLNYITRDVAYNADLPLYAVGYLKKSGKNVAFISKFTEDKKVDWVKEVTLDANSQFKAEKIAAYEKGVLAVVTNSKTDNAEVTSYKNAIVHFDKSGKLLFNKPIEDNNYPVFLSYDEINQLSYIAFGKKSASSSLYDEISMCQTDSVGNVVWQNAFSVKGNIIDMVRAEDKYIVYFNFQEYNILNKKQSAGKSGNFGVVAVDIALDGRILKAIPFVYSQGYYIERVYNISSDEINLIGYTGIPGNTDGRMVYIVVAPDGEIIFKNIE
ncbi:MAG: hypothetical protein KGZ97_07945 [Bacteroidetes bacterium]|nr:hypothetical protein [Bacteroidota bacterium]